ncbi:MAG: hypothetical protein VX527_02450 [Planctomycetota bacterium]|nr:hypothetical protein [Planctomycetota bacterium]
MKRFILGTLTGVLVVAIVVTFIPDRAHSLIDQAGDVRGLLEDVAARLDRLEQQPDQIESVEVLLPAPMSNQPAIVEHINYTAAETAQPSTATAIDIKRPAQTTVPTAVQRQAIDFDNLAAGLSRVSGALERLNRTMKPGKKSSRKSSDSTASDAASSS